MTTNLSLDEEEHLLTLLKKQPYIQQFCKYISSQTSNYRLLLKGVCASVPSLIITAAHEKTPMLCIADSEEKAAYLYSDLLQLLGHTFVSYFPSAFKRNIKYGHSNDAGEVLRSELITQLASEAEPIIVTYPDALIEKIPDKETVQEKLLSLQKGKVLSMPQLREYLENNAYQTVDYVYTPGEVAFRGSIIDIYPFNNEQPYRIDLFDDEIESIRLFDTHTQISVTEVTEARLSPNLLLLTENSGQSLLEFLPSRYSLFFYDYDHTIAQIEKISHEEAVIVEGEGFGSNQEMQQHLLAPQQLYNAFQERAHIYLSEPSHKCSKTITFHTSPQPLYHKNFDLIIEGFEHLHNNGYKIYFLTQSNQQADRLCEILQDRERADLLPTLLPITLHEGFEDHDSKVALITDHQLFERYHKYYLSAKKVRAGAASLTLKEISAFAPGDYIVHYDHGIGRFAGLFKTETGGITQEVIKIQYQGGDYIYVNLHSLHKLSKYRAKDDGAPQLSKLGSGAWERLKERTKKRIKDIARDLIKLYAARKECKGFAFSADSYLQCELEASFMYEETPDQLKAMEAVKSDMESSKPMDRLICGDVGFGKTEVAIRAAFKAVADSKQVAVLVPTTILAFQHFQTFSNRLKGLPVRVEYLSRGHGSKKTKQLLNDLSEGKIDIIIGTHRLVSKDVQFKDLGLLVIDEEQKFGVTVKEKLRKLQVNVDTLTMSATPIPRTLQFSLMGTRDLSNILTPPRNRYPIDTSIARFSGPLIKEAINYELSRDGQVFFVHNRINDIEEVANKIKEQVPDAKIAIGHGKLSQEQLEELFVAFSMHEYDVLVATTIIENGIDVANANTIFIDEAHKYGLSDLHQLRGRVGRSNKKAFCYLLTPPMDTLADTARRRLKTLETYSDLGSGMRIALQDLDIRGAGNVFGREQSGFIADLGFDTYHKLFDEAVKEVKRDEFIELFENDKELMEPQIDTLFESDLMLSFPPDYVPGDAERIELYRELDNLNKKEELQDFEKRLIDRFGAIPEEGKQLIQVPHIRALGRNLGIPKISLRGGQLRLFLYQGDHEFYQSESFMKILQYVTDHLTHSKIEENRRGDRIVRFEKVNTVYQALEILENICQL